MLDAVPGRQREGSQQTDGSLHPFPGVSKGKQRLVRIAEDFGGEGRLPDGAREMIARGR
jgi:hypothetical protein